MTQTENVCSSFGSGGKRPPNRKFGGSFLEGKDPQTPSCKSAHMKRNTKYIGGQIKGKKQEKVRKW